MSLSIRSDDDGFETRQKLREQFYFIEDTRDFLEWLFDCEIDYMTQQEAWEKFEKYKDERQTTNSATVPDQNTDKVQG